VVASVALIAAILALIFVFYDQSNQATPPPGPASPTAVPAPATIVPAWPLFRGNPERNGAMPGPGIRGEPVILWQYAAGSPARIAPVVDEGMVFISPDGDDLTVMDAGTGNVLWTTTAADGPLAVGGGILYSLTEDGSGLAAHDTVTAEELWRLSPASGFWSPILADGALYYGGVPNLLAAYDASTGEPRWQSEAQGFASRSAALGDGVLVVGSEDRIVFGIDQATGATIWSTAVDVDGTLQTPAILDGVAYFAAFGGARNGFFAFDLQTGTQLWRFDGVDGEGFWAPGAAGGLVYAPTDGERLYALDAKTGSVRWTVTGGGPMKSAPAIVDGVVYVAGDDGVLLALDAASGAELWRLPLDGAVTFGPILVDGVLYASTANGSLYALAGQDNAAAPASPAPDPTATAAAEASIAELLWSTSGEAENRLASPMVVRVSPDRLLWVSDSSGRFFIFDLDGNFIETWGSRGSGPGQFAFMAGGDFGGFFVFAPDGSLYVADTFNQRVQHFDADRNYVDSFGGKGAGDGQFQAPMAIAVDPAGNLVVVDAYRADVQRFSPDGTFLGKFDGTGAPGGAFNWPNGLAVASDGTIWVGDLGARTVRAFTSDGQEVGSLDAAAAGGFTNTHDIVVDADGFIYVADQEARAIKVFTADGRFVVQWGKFGSGDGQFLRVTSVAINRGGSVYAADYGNGRIQKFTLTGWPTVEPTPSP
jgi:outer membrane protein assembly factor BamB